MHVLIFVVSLGKPLYAEFGLPLLFTAFNHHFQRDRLAALAVVMEFVIST